MAQGIFEAYSHSYSDVRINHYPVTGLHSTVICNMIKMITIEVNGFLTGVKTMGDPVTWSQKLQYTTHENGKFLASVTGGKSREKCLALENLACHSIINHGLSLWNQVQSTGLNLMSHKFREADNWPLNVCPAVFEGLTRGTRVFCPVSRVVWGTWGRSRA